MDNNDGWLKLSPEELGKITHRPKSMTPVSDAAISRLDDESVANDVRAHIYTTLRRQELELISLKSKLHRIFLLSKL